MPAPRGFHHAKINRSSISWQGIRVARQFLSVLVAACYAFAAHADCDDDRILSLLLTGADRTVIEAECGRPALLGVCDAPHLLELFSGGRTTDQIAAQCGPLQQIYTIYFPPGGSRIADAASAMVIDEVSRWVSAMEHAGVVVMGHSDSSGSGESSQAIAFQRAQNVAQALTGRGVKVLSVASAGEEQPALATGDNVVETVNRRVTISMWQQPRPERRN